MLFNSWEFLILLLFTLGLYYTPFPGLRRKTWQVSLLLVSSAVFYAWEDPKLLILLSASCVVNALAVERILAAKAESRKLKPEIGEAKAGRWLFWTVALNLGFLAFFKYAGFFASQLPAGRTATLVVDWLKGIPLPVGISFYTFQGISLVVDVWRNDISQQTAERLSGCGKDRITSIRDTSFYVAFFPQLVAGPIVKAHEFVDQIDAKHFREIDWLTVRRGLVVGYFLKIFVADNLAEQTAFLSAGGSQLAQGSILNNLPLLYGYSFQIFADFAGYSLIAIGLGALFGYKLPPNFNFPYLSTSITEFWRRWHLSLSSWLRDYLYFPLGGNRKGAGRTYFNLFLVMFLGGLWHGAAWKFALWGSLHGLFLALERFTSGSKLWILNSKFWMKEPKVSAAANSSSSAFNIQHSTFNIAVNGVKWVFTFHIVTALWLTFMMPDLSSIIAFFKSLVNGRTWFSGPPIFSLIFYGSSVVFYHAWGWLQQHQSPLAHRMARSPLEPMLHGIMVFLIVTNPGAPRGFIYFQF